MPKYEYKVYRKVIVLNRGGVQAEVDDSSYLNKLGERGWELVFMQALLHPEQNVIFEIYVFKKER